MGHDKRESLPELERLDRSGPDAISSSQEKALRRHIVRLTADFPLHAKLLADIDTADLTLSAISALPTMDKAFLERHADELAPPTEDVVEIAYSSGTTGAALKIPFTDVALKRLEWNEFRALTICGLSAKDTVALTCTMDRCFIAGLAYQMGCRAVGAATIRVGAAPIPSHWKIIRETRPTAIIGVPSFLAKLAESAEGENPADIGVSRLICIGEPLRDADLQPLPLTRKIEKLWNAKAFSTYASTEICSAFCECEAQAGGHLLPELAIVEILDDNSAPLPPGAPGEITITPLGDGAAPLLRFKTGDVSFIVEEPCACGRTTPRLGPILGRKKQLLKHKGTAFYPNAIHAALSALDGVIEHQVAVRRNNLSDNVSVLVALDTGITQEHVEEKLRAALRVGVNVQTLPIDEIRRRVFPNNSRKPIRFVELD